MSKIIIREQDSDVVIHEIDTSDLSESQRERAFRGVCMQTDLERYFVDEE